MPRSLADSEANTPTAAPQWASWIGVIAVVFGVYMAASQGVEVTKQYTVVMPRSAETRAPVLRCPPDELVEEGISEEDCMQMAAMVKAQLVSRPDWFRTFRLTAGSIGIVLALFTIFAGIALVDWHSWTRRVAIAVFGASTVLNVIDFVVVLNTPPLLRGLYLWNSVLWILIYAGLTVGAIAGQSDARSPRHSV